MDQEQNQSVNTDQATDVDISAQLDNVKKRSLEALAPLLSGLDIDPERKFELCMNAMRLTDNKYLAEPALQAALNIKAEGTKAEALVELVNEINYLQQA